MKGENIIYFTKNVHETKLKKPSKVPEGLSKERKEVDRPRMKRRDYMCL